MELNKTDLIKKAIEELNKVGSISITVNTSMGHTPIDEDHNDWEQYLEDFRCPYCGRLINRISGKDEITQYKSWRRAENSNEEFGYSDIDDETIHETEIEYECNHCHTILDDAFRDRFDELTN